LGSYQNKTLQTTNFSGYDPSIPIRNAHFSDIRPAASGQFYLGPSYQKNFTNQRLEIFFGYEWVSWLNLQEIFRSSSGTLAEAKQTAINSSLLALQGLTTRVSLDY
jgi:hypothetical protein